MSEPAQVPVVVSNALTSLYLPIVLLSLSSLIASAQCSQAAPPMAATSTQAALSQQSNPAAVNSKSTSTSGMTHALRFATGSAVTVLEETPLQVSIDMPVSSRTTKAGAKLSFTVTRDVVVEGILVIPCGASVSGTVVSAKQAGRLAGSSSLILELTALNLDGKSYPLYTTPFKVVGQSKTGPTVDKVKNGAAEQASGMDAQIEASKPPEIAHQPGPRGLSDGVAAGVGAGVGAAIAASSPASIALIPAESQMEFTLASPIAVFPVDQPTAARLAKGMRHGGPVLYVHGESQ